MFFLLLGCFVGVFIIFTSTVYAIRAAVAVLCSQLAVRRKIGICRVMEEYKQIALSLKDQGNTAFQAGDNQAAIEFYSQV